MKTISVSVFKARCLALFNEVAARGESYVVTRHGRPVARIDPVRVGPGPRFGAMRGTVRSTGDIVSPVAPLSAWKALRR